MVAMASARSSNSSGACSHSRDSVPHSQQKISLALCSEVLENDPRQPVIYLRSFKDDKGAGRPMDVLRVSNMKYLWHMIFAFYNGLHEFMGWSEEEILAQVLTTVGPMVAIGRPGEKLPQLGAARVYVEDAVWQPKVHEFLEKAALVVLRLGKTEGSGGRWSSRQAGSIRDGLCFSFRWTASTTKSSGSGRKNISQGAPGLQFLTAAAHIRQAGRRQRSRDHLLQAGLDAGLREPVQGALAVEIQLPHDEPALFSQHLRLGAPACF